MSQNLTAITTAHARQLADQTPFIWLYDITVPTDPPTRYRLTNYDRNVEYGAQQDGTPNIYQPFPIVQSPVTTTAEGDLPQIQLQVSNEGLTMRGLMEDYDGFIGAQIVIRLVHILELGNLTAALRFDGQILSAKATYDRVSFNVSALSLTQAVVPGQRYIRGHCRFRYGDTRCGYDLNNSTLATAHPTCSKTLAACEERGEAEVAAGLLQLHPGRFGGWPGIPRQGRR